MSLMDREVVAAKPREKAYKLADGGGMYLEVLPSGGKSWRLKYRINGKEKRLALGLYPTITLKEARGRAQDARKLLANGIDPSENKKAAKAALRAPDTPAVHKDTFKDMAVLLLENKAKRCTEKYVDDFRRSLELHVYRELGDRSIREITGPQIIKHCQFIELAGHYLAHRMTQRIGEVFDFAVSLGKAEYNPVSKTTHKHLARHDRKNFNAFEFSELPTFLDKLEKSRAYPISKLAVRFLLLTFVRTGEMRALRWNMIDWGAREIKFPAKVMKARRDHFVPLSSQVLGILKEAQDITGGKPENPAFPMYRNYEKPASENMVLNILNNLGYSGTMTGHGFRSLARSTLAEHEGKFSRDALERQLAHLIKDKTEAAYDRAKHMPERVRMMQAWADLVDGI